MTIKCWNCGADATETIGHIYRNGDVIPKPLNKYSRCYCGECEKKVSTTEKEERKLYIKLKKREMFRKACDILENQHTDMYEYKPAIEVVGDFIEENPDKFDSSYEALTAIILVHNRIMSKMQYKVGRYQVDFLLPELRVVLEIDGERHKNRKEYDSERDRSIQKALGTGWKIIRIPTEHLDKNAKKLPIAIYKVIEYRQNGKVNWRELYSD